MHFEEGQIAEIDVSLENPQSRNRHELARYFHSRATAATRSKWRHLPGTEREEFISHYTLGTRPKPSPADVENHS